jgi:cephalosporin hydroxylase
MFAAAPSAEKHNHLKSRLKRILPPTILTRVRQLRDSMRYLLLPTYYTRGCAFARNWKENSAAEHSETDSLKSQTWSNPLWTYFTNHTEGHGICKWEHYFDIYHRHFSKFVGTPVKVLEIGIYSGGSLDMWKSYFGNECQIYGVDIEEACKTYECENVTVFIGDQEDPDFWTQFNNQVQGIDILIDDGGHTPNLQMVTLEQMLPYLRPGGVYLCEDVRGIHHGFAAFASGLVTELNKKVVRERTWVQANTVSGCMSFDSLLPLCGGH